VPAIRTRRTLRSASIAIGGIALSVAFLAPLLLATAATALPRSIPISRAGRIGGLRLNASTAAEVRRQWGAPDYTTIGNVDGTPSNHSTSGYPNYLLLGYRCHLIVGTTVCAINFYVSERTGRLESFLTRSPQFVFRGVRPGMSADVAAHRLHRPDESGCGQGIAASTSRLSVAIDTRGGHVHTRNHGLYVSGGTVADIAIDEKRYGVGVLFC
jgi:hypothetical protein